MSLRNLLEKPSLSLRKILAVAVLTLVLLSVPAVSPAQALVATSNPTIDISLAYDIGVTLASSIGSADTSLRISSGAKLTSFGSIFIDDEEIDYSFKNNDVLSGLFRGANGTSRASHKAGAKVYVKSETLEDQVKPLNDSGALANSYLGNAVQVGPPVISNVRISSFVVTGQTGGTQTIISWTTNKPSTSRVYFEEGAQGKALPASSTEIDPSLVTKHVVVTSAFRPGVLYRLRMESIDPLQERTLTGDYTVLAPHQQRTIFELIIENFSQIFSFFKKR